MSTFSQFQARHEDAQQEEYSLSEYLELCRNAPSVYASAAERMLGAIGEPELLDARKGPRPPRLFPNKVIRRYPAFSDATWQASYRRGR